MIRRLASGTWCRSSAPEGVLFISPSVKGPVFPPPIPVVGPALFPDLGGRVDGVCLVLSRPGCSKLKHHAQLCPFGVLRRRLRACPRL